ncbi:MAG: CoA ester lyase [Gammaproteobacteria bacterium]
MRTQTPVEPDFKLRRSVLYVPGSNDRALAKAGTLPADVLILDLEDAVLPAAKASARANVVAAVASGQFGRREVVIRINGLDTPWGEADLQAVSRSVASAILLPKISAAGTVQDVAAHLDAGTSDDMRLWCMLETPRAILDADQIAGSSARLAVLVMGTADLGKALRLPDDPHRTALAPVLAHCVLAARAAQLDILDGVYTRLADAGGFKAECQQGRQFGFDGKTLIHPNQVDACNEIFGVSAVEAERAAALIAAWDAAGVGSSGVIVHEQRMVEQLHVEEARRVLASHQAMLRNDNANN